jgi:hypothetical protein
LSLRCDLIYPKAAQLGERKARTLRRLILVATLGGPTMFARIGVMRALNRHVERAFNPSRRETRWGHRKLARDR